MFDGVLAREEKTPALEAIGEVITFYGGHPERWLQCDWRRGEDQKCLRQFLDDIGATRLLRRSILNAAQQVTGIVFITIPGMNDYRGMNYWTLMRILEQTCVNLGGSPKDFLDVIYGAKRRWRPTEEPIVADRDLIAA